MNFHLDKKFYHSYNLTVIFENLYFQVEKSAEKFQVWIETEERVGRGENKKYCNYCLVSIFDLFP